jgi:hypothetical protein
MGEVSAGVNLVAEDESELEEDEDEEWWVGTVGAVEAPEEMSESEPEGETQFTSNIFASDDDPKMEDGTECPLDAHTQGEPGEDRWWSPEPPQPSSEEDERKSSTLYVYWGLSPGKQSPPLREQWWT